MISSRHSANLAAILFVHNQCSYNVIELFWFVIALFRIYKEALNQSNYSNFSMYIIRWLKVRQHGVYDVTRKRSLTKNVRFDCYIFEYLLFTVHVWEGLLSESVLAPIGRLTFLLIN